MLLLLLAAPPPPDAQLKLSIDPTMARGPIEARVVIVEFSDYQ